jgi:hypothetical protein
MAELWRPPPLAESDQDSGLVQLNLPSTKVGIG